MKNIIFLLLFLVSLTNVFGQEDHYCLIDTSGVSQKSNYSSRSGFYAQINDGVSIQPNGTYRLLNIFVNIIYDQDPDMDPQGNSQNPTWPAALNQGVNNESIPIYLIDDSFLDVEFNPNDINGVMTKLYYESSFGKLIVLGDFMVVNIKQSYITPNDPGGNCSKSKMISKIFELINSYGGINTLNGYSFNDFDADSNGDIDMIQILLRNSFYYSRNNTFGGNNSGGGSINVNEYDLMVNGQIIKQKSVISYQGIGPGTAHLLNPTGIVVH